MRASLAAMTARDSVRFGILGTGLIARVHVIPALQRARRCALIGIASRSRDTAVQAATEFGIPRAYGSYEELLADPAIDAVYLPLPNDLHGVWTMRAASAGKHVLCEKPLTLTSVEAENVAAHCAASGVLAMEAFMYRFHPAWDKVRDLISEGAIGRVTDVAIWFAFRSVREADYRMEASSGGGAMYDVGCYAVNATRMLLGDDPERVAAFVRRHPETGVDMTFSAMLDYEDAFATFTVSMEQEPQHSIVIHGTAGWISIEDPFNCPADKATNVLIGTGGDHHPHASTIERIAVPAADQYGLQATALANAILDGGPSPLPLSDSITNMRLIERLFAAAGIEPPQPPLG